MAVTPNQRSVRVTRMDNNRKSAPSRIKAEISTTSDAIDSAPVQASCESVEFKEKIKDAPEMISTQISIPAATQPSIDQLPSSEVKEEAAQPRRSMTRTRKPSSRLLPSPSPPPPSRSVSNHHHHSSINKAAATVATSSVPASSGQKTTQKKQQTANVTSPTVVTEQTEVVNPSLASAEDKEFGPGKRKRRPSTMTKPPSTITKQTLLAPTSQGSIVSVPSAGPTTLKIRLNRVSSKSQSPEEKVQGGGATAVSREKTSRKVKLETVEESETIPVKAEQGYDSDGNAEGALLMDQGRDHEHDEESDAGPSMGSTTRKIILSRSKAHPLAAAREKFGGRRWPTCNGNILEPPPLISRRGGLKAHQRFSHTSQRSAKSASVEGSHVRSQSTSVLDGRWAWTPNGIAPTLRFRLGHEDEFSEASDLDDEDDFHVAMLHGDDFREAQHDKAASLSSKSSHRGSKSGDDSEVEDTPATTPRSPQSACDLPERRWSTSVDEDEKENHKNGKDAVFAHALEPSSRRPHTHAGSLTLSLPFEEMGQEEASERATLSGKNKFAQVIKSNEGNDEEGSIAAGLMSPAVQHSILGLSSKQHSLLLSSPHANSAFTSPAMGPSSSQGIKSDLLPLSLPPPITLPDESRDVDHEEGKEDAVNGTGMSSSAHHSSDEEEEEEEEERQQVYGHGAIVMVSPENMCLSELDRAWEQSEYLVKTRRLAGATEEELASEGDVEEAVIEASFVEEQPETQEQRPLRGSKRGSFTKVHEQVDVKKPKLSPKKQTAKEVTPRSGRRSARQSGTKV